MKPRHVEGKKYTPWEVSVPPSFTGTRRVRKFFPSERLADEYILRIKRDGFSNADTRPDIKTITISDCARQFRAKQEKNEKITQNQISLVLSSLESAFGTMAIESVSHRELDSWMNGLDFGYVTRCNYHRIARRFFAFCHDWLEVIPRNPMIKVPRPDGERNPIRILDPGEMRAALAIVKKFPSPWDVRMVAYLTICGFAGVRTREFLTMEWTDIMWQQGELFVRNPKKVTNWRPRWVEILPPLKRHLEPMALASGKISPGGMRSLYLQRKELVRLMEWPGWPDNCLRHSYKSYHAAEFQDIERTQIQMGHSDDNMTKYQYGTPEARAKAAEWWAL